MKTPYRLQVAALMVMSVAGVGSVLHAQGIGSSPPKRRNDHAPLGARDITMQVPQALAVLNGWQSQNPVRGNRVLRIVYWTPADREPAPRYQERLSKIMIDIQEFYAREMERNGFGRRTFNLDVQPNGLVRMTVSRGDKPRSHYSDETGDEIRRDSIAALQGAGVDGDKETVLIFCNLGDWDTQTRTITGSSPYYASGTTRKGTAWQSDSPILDVAGLTDVSEADKVHSDQYGFITLGHYDSIFIGGIAHELGHALSMPHDLERPDQSPWGKSLMGSGNRTYGEELRGDTNTESRGNGSFLTFADALRLASHPSFCGSVKGIEADSDAKFSDVQLKANGKTFIYSARVTGSVPVYGVIGYMDPNGGSDYDATTTTAVPDKEGRFKLDCNALVAGKGGVLRVVALQANGAATSAAAGAGTSPQYPYTVAADGTVDLSTWNTLQQLSPLTAAIKANDKARAQAALANLEAKGASDQVLEIARVQVAALDFQFGPSPALATGNTLSLSDARPTKARVGWLKPTYNRLPADLDGDDSPLLSADDKFYARGIYAHAPASHIYDLGGKWSHLKGTAGLAQGKGGSVVFVILGDGKELWRSGLLKDQGSAPFDINVAGIQNLELRVEDGGNGNSSDWALWLELTLTR